MSLRLQRLGHEQSHVKFESSGANSRRSARQFSYGSRRKRKRRARGLRKGLVTCFIFSSRRILQKPKNKFLDVIYSVNLETFGLILESKLTLLHSMKVNYSSIIIHQYIYD